MQPLQCVVITQSDTPARLLSLRGGKVWMTSSPHDIYIKGDTRDTMVGTKGSQVAIRSQSQKAYLSSDWSLQLDSMKLELLVSADQHAAVNTFPGIIHTARHTMRTGSTRSRCCRPARGTGAEGGAGDWGEVVTR